MTEPFQYQARIRHAATARPGHVGWTEVCELLDELGDDEVRAFHDELEIELAAHWSPELRVAPPRWASRLRVEGWEPRVELCRALDLSRTQAHDELWRALDAADAAGITQLDVAYCGLDGMAAPDLTRRLMRLAVTRLRLDGNPIGIAIAEVLQLSIGGSLTSLAASGCQIGDAELAALVAEGVALGLRELSLSVNYLSMRGVEHLARVPGLDGVRRLGLAGNKFLAAGVRVLAEQAPLRELRELDLEGTQCSDEGAAMLATAPAFARLETLSLMACLIGDAGAASLAAATALTRLRELNLKFNRITAAGARSLLASTQLTGLARLRLDHNEIEDDIVEVLASCPQVARLAALTLDDTYLSDEARAVLQALPRLIGVLELLFLREDA
jgi:hypothetical protein